MKPLLFILALLFATSLRAQAITSQPTNQTVTVGQTATFTLTVSGGPCRSFLVFSGLGLANKYGPYASTISFSLPAVTLAMNNGTVQFQLYSCTGGGSTLNSNVVTLTVTPVVTLNSVAITTPAPIIGVGQTDVLTLMGSYSDGSSQNLTSTAAWVATTPLVASVSVGTVLGVAPGSGIISATVGTFSTSTTITVEPSVQITFLPSNEDGSANTASLVVSQVVLNADGTVTATPVLQLPDVLGDTTLPLLYSPTLLYSVAFFLNNVPVGQPLVFSPVLMAAVMPSIKSMSYSVVLCVTSCTAGAAKSMSWAAN
jgi:hypothetical protein